MAAVAPSPSRADLDARDPDLLRERLPGAWLLASLYFRGEVRGLGNLPDEGPLLLVGNRSGGNVSVDSGVFALAFSAYFGVERPLFVLARERASHWPGFGLLRRLGVVTPAPDTAERALDTGAAVLVYPGGDHEAHRPVWRSGHVELGEDRSWIDVALAHRVPVVPVVAIGGQETAMFLTRGEGLARRLGLKRLLGVDALPVSLALPWGVNVGDVLGHWPLPSKITVETLPPIDLHARFGPEPDPEEVHASVTALMQDAVDTLAAERRLPVVG